MKQSDFFLDDGNEEVLSLPGGGQIRFISHWLNEERADALYALLDREISWQQPEISVYGVRRPIPRLQAWYGDAGASMSYSGRRFDPLAWAPALLSLRNEVQQQFACSFNSVLVNKYRHGDDSVGWHADDEPELGANPLIASLSLGAARKFCLKPKAKTIASNASAFSLQLRHGDLLLMSGEIQAHWLHAILKQKAVQDARINLTFRHILQSPPRLPNKATML